MVVFAPIFTLTGVEGRIFMPMGIAYVLSIVASTLVALTLSPAPCALLLSTWLRCRLKALGLSARRCTALHSRLSIMALAAPRQMLWLLPWQRWWRLS